MNHRLIFTLATSVLLALGAPFHASAGEFSRPNILLIKVDDVGAEDIGVFGHPVIKTPHIDRLANEGMRFTRAFTTSPVCSPSRASIATGLYPHQVGASTLGTPLPDEHKPLREYLKDAGYFVGRAGKMNLAGRHTATLDLAYNLREDSGTADWIRILRERPKDKPFGIILSSFDAHLPYDWSVPNARYTPDDVILPLKATGPLDIRISMSMYYDEISRVDRAIGEVIDELETQGVLDDTLIIFLSDNGSYYGQGKGNLYDAGIRTPLVMRWPKLIRPGQVNRQLVSTVDILPTILELIGKKPDRPLAGHSMVPTLKTAATPIRSQIVAERGNGSWYTYHQRVVRTDAFLYRRNTHHHQHHETHHAGCDLGDQYWFSDYEDWHYEELYDVRNDPRSTHNLAKDPAYQQALYEMRYRLNHWIQQTGDKTPPLIFAPCPDMPIPDQIEQMIEKVYFYEQPEAATKR